VETRVGKATDVGPGQMRRFQVEGTAVTIANVGGHRYAFDDTCTHEGCSLAAGELELRTVTCPCHGSQFDVTSGEVLRGPADEP
jgi:nitrite reductase/ring-hydroxylating ferredoxin subunit